MTVFTINAAPSGFNANDGIGPLPGFPLGYASTSSLTTFGEPAAAWTTSFPGFYVAMNGPTNVSIGPGDAVTYSMTVDSGTLYRPVRDLTTGAITGREEIGSATFLSPFAASGDGVAFRNAQGQLVGYRLSVAAGPFESFLQSLDFQFNGSSTNDVIFADRFGGFGNTATLNGGGGDDFLQGSGRAANTINGGGGNDDIRIQYFETPPSPVTHNVFGGSGADSISVFDAAGDQSNFFGGAGNDLLQGAGDGDYTMTGGAGDDHLQGENGGIAVFSGRRADYAVVETFFGIFVQDRRASSPDGSDRIGGLDLVRFSNGTFSLASLIGFGVTVTGTAGADVITPTSIVAGQPFPSDVVDTLFGNGGDDVLDGGLGADLMYGGAGNDTYFVEAPYAGAFDQVIELSGSGIDTVISAAFSYTLGAFVENLTLANVADAFGGTGNGLANTIRGNALANQLSGAGGADALFGGNGMDILSGGTGSDQLFGGQGADSLFGDAGNDRLDGGPGADLMIGDSGDDIYVVDDPGDFAAENPGGGTDTVQSTVTYSLGVSGNSIENLTLLGAAAINGTGDAAANALVANAAANALSGLGGADTLTGGEGADILSGGLGADRFVFTAASQSNGAARDRIVAGEGAPAFEGVGGAGGDLIDLAAIDADGSTPGNQAFTFGGTGVGSLSVVTSGSGSLVRGNTDTDTSFEFEVLIADADVLASAYRATDFIL